MYWSISILLGLMRLEESTNLMLDRVNGIRLMIAKFQSSVVVSCYTFVIGEY